jgi:hypothetical protein
MRPIPRVLGFLAVVASLAAVWLVLLPAVAARPAMHEHLEWLEARKINPGAMYYTELEAMPDVLERMYERERQTK